MVIVVVNVVVNVGAIVQLTVAPIVAQIVVTVESALHLDAAIVLHRLAATENSLPARTIDVTATEIGSATVTTMTDAALAAQSTVIEIGRIVIVVTMIVMPLLTATIEKVRLSLQLATMSSCPGIEADTRISSRFSTTCSR
jgi:hypothetical protein